MDIEFLVQMKQSNKWESVRNDEIFYSHIGSGAVIINNLCWLNVQKLVLIDMTKVGSCKF